LTEAETIEQLVEFQTVLLTGVTVYFTIISAYVVGLYAFLDEAGFLLKFFAFLFLTVTLLFLGTLFFGAANFQSGLVDVLREIDADSARSLSPAGRAALGNADSGVDQYIRTGFLAASGGFYLALAVLTYWNGWRKSAHIRVKEAA
jgi:hypothetical protein